ncbi:MAG: sulfite exporter TauE/SafE family protein [Candidatus Thiodiazotropha sp. (ex Ctena orbiculata)]|uniref:Sulfite exporter TauE/SafE family protein n=1 Tax=Candidatus Thiodiazotropha taylori TaxID=2792791 RepID=A0A944M7L6_9GAMM|nr:sulfite exporter TauE/SafE family protein [Candidatus Thiodiazotropha taylori]MBT2988709.1 sulfite exporter TauE/SafE family protein [Candidatus Thiodiazotropha taylori]MBT2996724.1 sulfite exporter TauE/SafE family protein [Candidatus Thiodiazotropha taylori]MBT3001404.1 sulfite exporter TauE/SafE family protein [Candidatus Thiodiazotropha taylori]MBT3027207.1 sulfite exporter TauE/SafE family protein [Candidatus Thiodiazotropha taylori]
MIPIEPVSLSFGAALLLGLSFGAGPCTIACLPYLGPVFTSCDQGRGSTWRTLVPFSLGRVSGYTLLAAAAGWVGLWVEDLVAGPWVRWLLGGATVLVALSILLRRRPDRCASAFQTSQTVKLTSKPGAGVGTIERSSLPGGLYLMGLGMALNPCAPLTTLILAAATSASLITGAFLGAGFALGAVLLPTLVFAFGVAHLGRQIRLHLARHRIALENTSIGLLLMIGCATALGWITP